MKVSCSYLRRTAAIISGSVASSWPSGLQFGELISDQMGHAQISTTADIYGHLIRQPAEVTNAFEKIRPVA